MTRHAGKSETKAKDNQAHDDMGMQNLWRFMAFVKPYWKWLLGASIAGLIRMVLPLYMPTFVKNVIDRTLVPAWS
jgi:ABC-type bacteriocin/lantibiotic exporter with double-glycine peptidase domain